MTDKYDFSGLDQYDFSGLEDPKERSTLDEVAESAKAFTAQLGNPFGITENVLGPAAQAAAQHLGEMTGPASVDQQLLDQGFTGDLEKSKSLLEKYRSARPEIKAQYKELTDANPLSSFAGSMTSGLALPLGAAAKAETLGAKLLSGAKMGGALGGLTGAINSSADLTKGIDQPEMLPQELAQLGIDTGIGTTLGAGAGAAIPLAGAGISKIGQGLGSIADTALDTIPALRQAVDAGKLAYDGLSVVGTKAKEEIQEGVKNKSEEIVNALKNNLSLFGKAKSKILDKANNLGKSANVDEELASMLKMVENIPGKNKNIQADKESLKNLIKGYQNTKNVNILEPTKSVGGKAALSGEQKVMADLNNQKNKLLTSAKELGETPNLSEIKIDKENGTAFFTDLNNGKVYSKTLSSEAPFTPLELVSKEVPLKTTLNPTELNQAYKDVYDLAEKAESGLSKKIAGKVAGRFKELGEESLEELSPAFDQVNTGFSKSKEALKILNPKLESMDRVEKEEAQNALTSFFENMEANSKGGDSAQKTLESFMKRFKATNKELAEKITPELEELAKRFDLNKEAQKSGPLSLGTFKGLGIRGGEIIGKTMKEVGSAPTKIMSAGKKYVTDNTPEAIQDLASKLFSKGSTKYGNVLSQLATKPERTRNAMIFSLMQRPDFRELLSEGETDEP